jgi:hypothetical protein
MPKKRAKKTPATTPRRPPVERSRASKKSSSSKSEERAFVASLVAHRQAVAVAPGTKLPPGATHELTATGGGQPKVVRKRFSAI